VSVIQEVSRFFDLRKNPVIGFIGESLDEGIYGVVVVSEVVKRIDGRQNGGFGSENNRDIRCLQQSFQIIDGFEERGVVDRNDRSVMPLQGYDLVTFEKLKGAPDR